MWKAGAFPVSVPPSNDLSIEQFGYKQELRRSLTFWDLVAYGLVFMVPIAPMGIFGQVIQTANGMVVLAYLIGLVGMIFTAYSYFRMSEAFPVAGSAYAYVQRGWHPDVGFVAGWMILLDYILIPALLYLVSAAWLAALVPWMPTWAWVVIFVVINTLINIGGIEMTNTANWIILVIEGITFLLFSIMALVYVGGGHGGTHFTLSPIFNSHGFSLSMVGAATSIAVLSFLGFDGISTLSEETRGGRQTVGKATVWSLVIVCFLFVVLTYLAAVAYPNYMHFPDINNAFYYVAQRVGGSWLSMLCLVVTVVSWGFANALAAQAAVSRMLFSMGRDRMLPQILSWVHPRRKTPVVATLLVGVLSIVVTSFLSIANLSRLVNFGALTAFMLLNLTVILFHYFRKRSQRFLAHLVMPAVGFLVLLYVWANFDRLTFYMGIGWFVLGMIILGFTTKGFRHLPKELEGL